MFRTALATLVLSAVAAAQCSTLTATTSAAGLTLSLTGASPMSIAVAVIGETAGTTSIPVGATTLDLGLAMPFTPFPIGFTGPTGDASTLIRIPRNLPLTNLLAQGVAISFGTPSPSNPMPTLSFCTSNVASFTVGG